MKWMKNKYGRKTYAKLDNFEYLRSENSK
jgi:hypothetical protein